MSSKLVALDDHNFIRPHMIVRMRLHKIHETPVGSSKLSLWLTNPTGVPCITVCYDTEEARGSVIKALLTSANR